MPGACSLTHRVKMHLDRWKHVLAFVLASRRTLPRSTLPHLHTHCKHEVFLSHLSSTHRYVWPFGYCRICAGFNKRQAHIAISQNAKLFFFPYTLREVLGFFICSFRFCLIIMIFQCHFFNLPREDNFYLKIEHHNYHTISLKNSLVLQYSISSLCLQPVIAPFGFSILLQLMLCCIRVHFLAATWPVEHFVNKE